MHTHHRFSRAFLERMGEDMSQWKVLVLAVRLRFRRVYHKGSSCSAWFAASHLSWTSIWCCPLYRGGWARWAAICSTDCLVPCYLCRYHLGFSFKQVGLQNGAWINHPNERPLEMWRNLFDFYGYDVVQFDGMVRATYYRGNCIAYKRGGWPWTYYKGNIASKHWQRCVGVLKNWEK